MTSLDSLLAEAGKDGRICPQPIIWDRLWKLLPGKPPTPLILAGWAYSSDAEKRARFHEHLRWAFEHGALEKVADLISKMKPEDWHTER